MNQIQFKSLVAALIASHGHAGAAKQLQRMGLMEKPRVTGSHTCAGAGPGFFPCNRTISANKERCAACEQKHVTTFIEVPKAA